MFVYSDVYDLDWPGHVFPTQKYRLLYERLLAEALMNEKMFISPEPASDEDVKLVHGKAYLHMLCAMTTNTNMAIWANFEALITKTGLRAL